MNKKQINDIIEQYINFEIHTADWESPILSMKDVEFNGDRVIILHLHDQQDVYLDISSIIRVVGFN